MSLTIPAQIEHEATLPAPTLSSYRRARRWVRVNFEKFGPGGGGVGFFLACLAVPCSNEVWASAVNRVLESVVQAASILAGFQATALGLLLAINSTELGRLLRHHALFGVMVRYQRSAVIWMLILATFSLVLLGLSGVDPHLWSRARLAGAGLVGLGVLALACTARVTLQLIALSGLKEASEAPKR